jgi:hypothetical protein
MRSFLSGSLTAVALLLMLFSFRVDESREVFYGEKFAGLNEQTSAASAIKSLNEDESFGKITAHLQANFPNVDFSQKLILVSFWSSENAQSRMENRELFAVWDIYKAALLKNGKKGVVFYAISTDQNKLNWEIACKKDRLEGIVSYYGGEGMETDIVKSVDVKNIPHNILYDSNGKVIATDMKTHDEIFNTFLQQITRQ